MEQRLEGKIALVTGGASGIGQAIVTLFARHGATVAIADVQKVRTEQLFSLLREDERHVRFLQVDLAEAEQASELVPRVTDAFGGLDVLVNAAAFFGPANKRAAGDTPLPIWDRTMQVNVTAPLLLCRAAIPVMAGRGGGSIINIASIGGLEAFAEFSAYSVSKAALIQLTKSLALDYGSQGIRANAICPGAIDTPGNDAFVADRDAYLRAIKSVTPLGRPGNPTEVATAALFLASDDSSYITGTTLLVDGGRMAQA